ncbi:hypothetical protein SLEP1_g395 [Rubroshorea leprosula]|uniref:Uncharacterized protein n=1 Tax=Rubroshorea leprosula TaxID=152421 RepID=A0AAV5HJ44_9ROSI|nr:hypothetical protein SLEP1_g395 [Rubroshorea leprosula]
MDCIGRNIGGEDGGSFGLGRCWCRFLIGSRYAVIDVRLLKTVRFRGCTGEGDDLGRLTRKRYGGNGRGMVEEVEA